MAIPLEKREIAIERTGKVRLFHTRDNEIAKLLQNVTVGSTIEFPANVKDKSALSARKLSPVKTCRD